MEDLTEEEYYEYFASADEIAAVDYEPDYAVEDDSESLVVSESAASSSQSSTPPSPSTSGQASNANTASSSQYDQLRQALDEYNED